MNEKKKLDLILKYYIAGGIVFLILAVVAVKLMSPSTYQVVVNYWAANPLLSQTSTVFAPASHLLWNIQFRWVVAILLLLSVVSPAYYVYAITNNFKKIDFHKYRFLDWLVTSSVMLLIILALAGVQDLMTLIVLLGLNVLAYCLFWKTNTNFGVKESYNSTIHKLGGVAILLPWLLILIYALSTLLYGDVRSPGFVYVLYLVGLVNSIVVIFGYYWHKARVNSKAKISDETSPILFNQIVKVLFVLILIIGLKH
jgi:hypothetical protein